MNPADFSRLEDKNEPKPQNELKQSPPKRRISSNRDLSSESDFVYENNAMSQVNMEIHNFVTTSDILVKILHRRDELVSLHHEVIDKESEYKSVYGFKKNIEFLNDEEKERHKLLLKLNSIK